MLIRNVAAALAVVVSLAAVSFAQTGAPSAPKASPSPAAGKKAGPVRHPKTGRFVSEKKAPAMAGAKGGAATGAKKSAPARDLKTGRFMKKGGTPAGAPTPTAPKKP